MAPKPPSWPCPPTPSRRGLPGSPHPQEAHHLSGTSSPPTSSAPGRSRSAHLRMLKMGLSVVPLGASRRQGVRTSTGGVTSTIVAFTAAVQQTQGQSLVHSHRSCIKVFFEFCRSKASLLPKTSVFFRKDPLGSHTRRPILWGLKGALGAKPRLCSNRTVGNKPVNLPLIPHPPPPAGH